jgi:hypothetical protein
VKIRKKRSLPLEVKLARAAPLARWAEPRRRPVVPWLQSSSSSPKSGVPAGRLPAAWSGEARSPLPFLACPATARTGRPRAALEAEELAQRIALRRPPRRRPLRSSRGCSRSSRLRQWTARCSGLELAVVHCSLAACYTPSRGGWQQAVASQQLAGLPAFDQTGSQFCSYSNSNACSVFTLVWSTT